MTTCNVCGERVPAGEVMEHLRLFHPDDYGDDAEPEGVEVARVTIVRFVTDDGVEDHLSAVRNDGDDLPLTEALGMMRLAEDTLIRTRMDE